MNVLFATAELAPLVKVGGLADFSAGLVNAVRSRQVDVDIVLPDYGEAVFEAGRRYELPVPQWAGPATLRQGTLGGIAVALISVPGMARPNPYLDASGQGWPDNDKRFLAFSAAVAAWAEITKPDLLHLNDWHTASVLGYLDSPPPSVMAIHNLAYQGTTGPEWVETLNRRRAAYQRDGCTNPLAGGIVLADRVVTVSPTFAAESLQPGTGFGLDDLLRDRGTAFSGILNGIDTAVWDPSSDVHLSHHYDLDSPKEKGHMRQALAAELGWGGSDVPLIGMVTRLTDQKGVDIALETIPLLEDLDARMVLLGSGDRSLAEVSRDVAHAYPDRFMFREGYDERLAHRIFGGSDLYLMPSRFEPAGLTQMQAMRYGSIPVVTDVGGLHDTVTDADLSSADGTGYVADEVSASSVSDALGRAVGGWRAPTRRDEIIRRGMSRDWSWQTPASRYLDLYRQLTSAR